MEPTPYYVDGIYSFQCNIFVKHLKQVRLDTAYFAEN